MAFKIPNFSKQMGGSPFKNVDYSAYRLPNYADKKAGYAYHKALNDYRKNLFKNDPAVTVIVAPSSNVIGPIKEV